MKFAKAAPTPTRPTLEDSAERDVLDARPFGGPVATANGPDADLLLRRAVFGRSPLGAALFVPIAGVIVAIAVLILVGAVPTASGARGVATAPAVALLALVVTPAFQLALVLGTRRRWPAQEACLWFRLMSADRWRATYGDNLPGGSGQAREWLARHRVGPASDFTRAAMLAAVGRTAEAREVVAGLPSSTPVDRWWRAELSLELDAKEGRKFDAAQADDAIRADPGASPAERDLACAFHAALQAAARGDDSTSTLAVARRTAGPMPARYSRRIMLNRYRGVLAAALAGIWILVAITVGMAMSGGVVWL